MTVTVRSTTRNAFALTALLVAFSIPARAEAPRDDASEAGVPAAPHEKKPKKRDRAAKRKLLSALGATQATALGTLEVGGRVFARAALSRHYEGVTLANGAPGETRVDSLDFGIPTARAELRYRAPARWFSADLEFELADQPELKDAWLRARGRHFGVQLGQFKAPFSAIELESRFALPVAERGFLHDILTKQLEVAGRRPGVTLEARAGGALRPSLKLGAFQGSVLVERDASDRKREPLFEQTLDAQSLFARAEIRVADLVLGAGYEHRVGTPELLTVAHYPTAGIDLTLDTHAHGRGLRLWVEALVGSSWYEHSRKPVDDSDATFSAARLIVAPRLGGDSPQGLYFEPYGMVGVLDPDTEVVSDLAVEQALGANVGLWRLARVGLELQHRLVERNFPQSYTLGRNPERLALVLQAAADF